jgi:hypothetical protein
MESAMGDLIPTTRQVRRKDGTVYQAIRHVRASGDEPAKKGWTPPQVASPESANQLRFATIHNSLAKRGFSDSNISFALDISINKSGFDAHTLTATKMMSALNDCYDALGEMDYSFSDKQTQQVAERVIIASLHQLPTNERVRGMVQNPDIDLDRLISLINDDGITDPARLEMLFQGGAKSLSDGAL